jgi:hypothetical protein
MEKNIQLRASTLPEKIEQLRDFVILNTERLKAYRARVDAAETNGILCASLGAKSK